MRHLNLAGLALASVFMIISAIGCESGKPWTHCNGSGCPDLAGPSQDSGAAAQQSQPDAGAASAADTATTQQQEVAQAAPTCTPKCNGKVCGSDGCGGSCGTCNASQSCNSYGHCVASSTGGGGGADAVSGGGSQPAPCGGGCQAGYVCNSTTGQCQPASSGSTQGDLSCWIQRADSTAWSHLSGGSIVSVADAGKDSWSNLGTPDASGKVAFTIKGGNAAVSFLPVIEAEKKWAYGSDGGSGKDVIKGQWKVWCGSNPVYTFVDHDSTPVCSIATPANTGCRWKGGPGEYRLAFKGR